MVVHISLAEKHVELDESGHQMADLPYKPQLPLSEEF
jgi:hypothetical protein